MPRSAFRVPMVAREAEMDRLRAAVDRARDGTAGAVLIRGDAGVGKTRLLEELIPICREAGWSVLLGRCLDLGDGGPPYLPFVDMLVATGEIDPDVLSAHPVLGRLLPGRESDDEEPPLTRGLTAEASAPGTSPTRALHGDPDVLRTRLMDAVQGVLTDLAAAGGVLLAIEDLHWADAASRHLLAFLLSRLGSQRLLVVATYRGDDLHRRHPLKRLLAELVRSPDVDHLDVEPLDVAASGELVRSLTGGELSEDMVRRIVQRAAGNPFFLEELATAPTTDPEEVGGGAEVDGLPVQLTDLLMARIEHLNPAAERVVRAAAVAGPRVRHARLRTVADLPDTELDAALREAVQDGVLRIDGADSYVFRHALLAEAVYADLLPGERVRLHAAYAAALADDPDPRAVAADLARHSLLSNDLRTALTASVRAAERAGAVGAPQEKLAHLEQALRLWNAVERPVLCCGEDELTLLLRASSAASAAGGTERAIAYARSAIELADRREDPYLAANARHALVRQLSTTDGTIEEARRLVDEALALVADRPPTEVTAWVLADHAMVSWDSGRFDPSGARSIAERAVRVAAEVGAGGVEVDALVTLASLDEYAGNSDAAIDRLSAAAARARAADVATLGGELRALYRIAVNRYEVADHGAAHRTIDEGVELAVRTGMGLSSYGLALRLLQCTIRYVTGDWDGAEAAAEIDTVVPHGITANLISALGLSVMVGRGRFEAAEPRLERLREDRNPELMIPQMAGITGAEMELWRGHPDRAVDYVEHGLERLRALDEAEKLGSIRLVTFGIAATADIAREARRRRDDVAADRSAEAGRAHLDHVRRVVKRARPRTGELGPEARAWVARAEAEATRLTADRGGAGDPEAWEAVVDAFGYGNRYEEAIARWRWAEALLADGQRDPAVEELRRAEAVARELGAEPLLAAVTGSARRARVGFAAADRHDTGPLTSREYAVLEQVARGLTNRQIGEALFISEKTVSVHLTRVMAKLDASSRTEAVAIAYDRGLLR